MKNELKGFVWETPNHFYLLCYVTIADVLHILLIRLLGEFYINWLEAYFYSFKTVVFMKNLQMRHFLPYLWSFASVSHNDDSDMSHVAYQYKNTAFSCFGGRKHYL